MAMHVMWGGREASRPLTKHNRTETCTISLLEKFTRVRLSTVMSLKRLHLVLKHLLSTCLR